MNHEHTENDRLVLEFFQRCAELQDWPPDADRYMHLTIEVGGRRLALGEAGPDDLDQWAREQEAAANRRGSGRN